MRQLSSGLYAVLLGVAAASAETLDLPTPSDDRWAYPFNFQPGTRFTGSCFGAAGEPGFNDRDGQVIVAWHTAAGLTPGLGRDAYGVRSVRVTLTNTRNAAWLVDATPDEWFTYDVNNDEVVNADHVPRGQPGDTDGESDDPDPGRPVELFGAGFGPEYSLQSWVETSLFVGSGGDGDVARDPFPFIFQDSTQALLHVEDSVKGLFNDALLPPVYAFTPLPWAIGIPLNYMPGNQPTPFDVVFDIDLALSQGRVRGYFQEQLDAGRVAVIVTSPAEAQIQGSQSGYPSFIMKEGIGLYPGAKAARLQIVACRAVAPDFDRDCDVDLVDLGRLEACAAGPAIPPAGADCGPMDLDHDHDVDQSDFGLLQRCFAGPGVEPAADCMNP